MDETYDTESFFSATTSDTPASITASTLPPDQTFQQSDVYGPEFQSSIKGKRGHSSWVWKYSVELHSKWNGKKYWLCNQCNIILLLIIIFLKKFRPCEAQEAHDYPQYEVPLSQLYNIAYD